MRDVAPGRGPLTGSNPAGVVFDNLGVPTSIYFMWAVYRLNKDSERDWNRARWSAAPLRSAVVPRG